MEVKNGMTMRDVFAASALFSLCPVQVTIDDLKLLKEENLEDLEMREGVAALAKACYVIADAMMKGREA